MWLVKAHQHAMYLKQKEIKELDVTRQVHLHVSKQIRDKGTRCNWLLAQLDESVKIQLS